MPTLPPKVAVIKYGMVDGHEGFAICIFREQGEDGLWPGLRLSGARTSCHGPGLAASWVTSAADGTVPCSSRARRSLRRETSE